MVNRFYQALGETLNFITKHKKESALIALAFLGMSCQKCAKDRAPYEYCGMVEQDSVEFKIKKGMDGYNYLTFYNEGGKIKLYDRWENDLKFEDVYVFEKNSSFKRYDLDDKEIGKYVVEVWQAKADYVLPKILEIKEQKREKREQEKEQERQAKIKEGLKYLK